VYQKKSAFRPNRDFDLRRVSWREGTRGTMHSRFAALRVRVAHRDYERSQPQEEQ
jgi:SRSO17 transposase